VQAAERSATYWTSKTKTQLRQFLIVVAQQATFARHLAINSKAKTVGEIANLAAKGDDAAETALKTIIQAAKKGQR
jgi:hypothetical protein